MIDVVVALIGAVSAVVAVWLSGRASRGKIQEVSDKVSPVSNGFAKGVTGSLDLIIQELGEIKEEQSRLSETMTTHLRDHAVGKLERKRNRDA